MKAGGPGGRSLGLWKIMIRAYTFITCRKVSKYAGKYASAESYANAAISRDFPILLILLVQRQDACAVGMPRSSGFDVVCGDLAGSQG